MLLADIESLREWLDGIGEDRGVEVHGHLYEGDRDEIGPFLPRRPAVSQFLITFVFLELAFPVGTNALLLDSGMFPLGPLNSRVGDDRGIRRATIVWVPLLLRGRPVVILKCLLDLAV
jgi:hypothetical protein